MGNFWAPDEIFGPIQLSPNARLLFLYFSRRADKTGLSYPTLSTASRDCGFSRRTTIRTIRELEMLGLISVKHSPGRKTNEYLLNGAKLSQLNGVKYSPLPLNGAKGAPLNGAKTDSPTVPASHPEGKEERRNSHSLKESDNGGPLKQVRDYDVREKEALSFYEALPPSDKRNFEAGAIGMNTFGSPVPTRGSSGMKKLLVAWYEELGCPTIETAGEDRP